VSQLQCPVLLQIVAALTPNGCLSGRRSVTGKRPNCLRNGSSGSQSWTAPESPPGNQAVGRRASRSRAVRRWYPLTMPAILNTVPASPSIVEIEVGGILFDMDGVLVRSTSGDERCWTRWAERHRLTASFDLRKTHGWRAADTIREHLPHISEAELKQHLSDLDVFAEEEQIGVTAFPGARELLSSIPSHRMRRLVSGPDDRQAARCSPSRRPMTSRSYGRRI